MALTSLETDESSFDDATTTPRFSFALSNLLLNLHQGSVPWEAFLLQPTLGSLDLYTDGTYLNAILPHLQALAPNLISLKLFADPLTLIPSLLPFLARCSALRHFHIRGGRRFTVDL